MVPCKGEFLQSENSSLSNVHGCTFRSGTDAAGSMQKQDDMFLITGKCGTLIRRDKGAGSRLTQNARKS